MKALTLLMVVLSLGACASVGRPDCEKAWRCSSSIISTKHKSMSVENGVIYAIPTQKLEFSFVRKKVTKKSLDEALAKATAALAKAKKKKSDQEESIIPPLERAVKQASSKEAKAKLALSLELAKLKLTEFEFKLKKADIKNSLAKKRVEKYKRDYFEDDIKLVALPPTPSDILMVAKRNSGRFSSNEIELKTATDGLLSGGFGKSQGQADEIFVSLVSAISAIKAVSSPAGNQLFINAESFAPTPKKKPIPACQKKAVKFTHKFYSDDAEAEKEINEFLKGGNVCGGYVLTNKATNTKRKTKIIDSEKIYNGLIYPRVKVAEFELAVTDNKGTVTQKPFAPRIVDANSLGVLSLDKGLFADNNYEFEFDKGMLKRFKSVTGNELVGFFGMFPAAAKSIISIPAEIVKLKVDYSSAEEGYYEAQQAALEARLAYEKELESLGE